MEKKQTIWKTKGMNQDLSVSAFNNEFSFENMNLRLSTNEGNTLMSWANEKGTKEMFLRINQEYWDNIQGYFSFILEGVPIGTAVINHQLVLFTTIVGGVSNTPDRIYVLKISDSVPDTLEGILLFRGKLNFKYGHPLETLVSYESDTVQKVYWTDGVNQPRVINIAAGIDKIKKWNDSTDEPIATYFDFVPALSGNEVITITKRTSSGGIFAPGVIQYALSYVNIYGQQSNLFYVSPLYYLALYDRGARPDEKVTSSFNIKIHNVDQKFDFLRIYSIQRTSINNTPIVKLLDTLATTNTDLEYTDNGTTGATMDPTELLFAGGKEITALTMVDKDQTLFLGNIEEKNVLVTDYQNHFRNNKPNIEYFNTGANDIKKLTLDTTTGIYSHTNLLEWNQREITTFKGGEKYRFGFQLQKKTGEWSEPIWIGDKLNDKYPNTSVYSNDIYLVYAKASIDLSAAGVDLSIYKKIRPVVVFPTIGDRNILCQGVLNPTVFNVVDRADNSPFAQASWYFRPYMVTESGSTPQEDVAIEAQDIIVSSTAPSIQGQDYFRMNGYLQSVYVLKASVPTGAAGNDIIKRKYLRGQLSEQIVDSTQTTTGFGGRTSVIGGSRTSDAISSYPFIGAILLDSSTNTYAFISSSPWKKPVTTSPSDSNIKYFNYLDGVSNADTNENETFDFLNTRGGLEVTDSGLLYYANIDNNSPSSYVFNFEIGTTDYYVTFNNFSNKPDYTPISDDRSGSAVAFTHYGTLDYNAVSNGGSRRANSSKSLEIQGSVKMYNTPFGTEKLKDDNDREIQSNTQFFVDQSIVTLNSPDLEFDTEVQSYGNEGFHLRIVGAIPITANASDHKINASASLQTNLNVEGANSHYFGVGEVKNNVVHSNIDSRAGKRLTAEYLWDDVQISGIVEEEGEKIVKTRSNTTKYLIYPWHKIGPLNNDWRSINEASSVLKTKKESNLLFSNNTEYFQPHGISEDYSYNIGMQLSLYENAEVFNLRLPKQTTNENNSSEINYYPNVDKILYNEAGMRVVSGGSTFGSGTFGGKITREEASNYSPVTIPMKYKSGTHAVLSLNASNNSSYIPILPSVDACGAFSTNDHNTFWNKIVYFTQKSLNSTDFNKLFLYNNAHVNHNLLWLGEIYKDVDDTTRFGGDSKEAIKSNTWFIGGEEKIIPEGSSNIDLYWTEGDTYYQRYDALKTYAYTKDDVNQLVEILSFMCETHVNIDGRYDRNRGQIRSYDMDPTIFNLLNDVYSQKNNFFVGRVYNNDDKDSLVYPNQIYYTLTKESGADVDKWTNISLGSTLELDGGKGKISKLARLNDSLLAFQDTGISQILYNENVQIASTAGVPIEIANSGKVQGKRYISDTIGCSNKWSVCQTPSGIYFIDSHDKGIYLFNGQLQNLSVAGGFNSWSKNNIELTDRGWNPWDFEDFVTYYDKQNKDVLFINSETALAYSEKIGAFTSFYNYEDTAYLCNLDGRGFWIKADSPVQSYIWGHQEGEYCNFFDTEMPYWMTLVGNPDPQRDKTFTNLEFRVCVDGDGEYSENTGKFTPTLPFSTLETWNEYQHGITALKNKVGHSSMMHHTPDKESALKRKFRIWRCDIPRDNAPLSSDANRHVSRFKLRPLDRMRNPWIYLELYKGEDTNKRVEIHDVMMSYYE